MAEGPAQNPNTRSAGEPAPAPVPGTFPLGRNFGELPSGSVRGGSILPSMQEGPSGSRGTSTQAGSAGGSAAGSGSQQPRCGTGNTCTKGGMAHDGQKTVETDTHPLNYPRYVEVIYPENTTTGLNNSNLVIKGGILRQGLTYLIELTVTTTDGRLPVGEGSARVWFEVNVSPQGGMARVTPDQGIELDTVFRVFFSEWQDLHEPLRYEVSYTRGGSDLKEVLYSGQKYDIEFTLPAGENIEIHLGIRDRLGAKTSVCKLPVQVVAKQLGSQNETEEEYLMRLLESNSHISKGDHRQAMLTMQNVVIILNRRTTAHARAQNQNNIRCMIRNYILNAIRAFPLRDEFETQQTLQTAVSSTSIAEEMIGDALRHAADITMATTERARDLSAQSVLDTAITELSLKIISQVLATVPYFSDQQNTVDVKDVVYKARSSLNNVLNTVVHSQVMGEEPVKQQSGDVFMCVGRYRTDDVPPLQTPSGSFSLPKRMSAILAQNGLNISQSGDCWQAQMVSYNGSPFVYGKGINKTIQSRVPALTINSCTSQEIPIRNLPDDESITVKIPHLPGKEREQPALHRLNKDSMNLHPFNVSSSSVGQALLVTVDLVQTGLRTFPIALLLSGDEAPYTDDVIIKRERYRAEEDHLAFFIKPGLLNATGYHLAVVHADYKEPTPNRQGEALNRTYSLRMRTGECVFWDEQNDTWSTEGCKIQPSSTYTTTHCRCNHLTAFAARFEPLKPNDLNLQNIGELFDLKENPVTIALVGTLILLYILLLIIALRFDAHDQQKGAIVNVIDNSPDYSQKYLITMETGFRKAAGTTAKVSMILHGEEGMSETRELISESGQPLFERNSRDTFIVMLPESLGKVLRIQLWHNNAGPSPSWYLSRVTVKDVNMGRSYYFNCEKWFSVDDEDCRIEREITVMEGGLGFYKVLKAKGTQYLTDYHLWFSALTRPSYSCFTRAQRLTCCLSLLMSYMAVNAAWYRRTYREYSGEFGLIDVSWRSVYVGIITSLVVLPPNFLITLLFRRSKIKRVRMEEMPGKKAAVGGGGGTGGSPGGGGGTGGGGNRKLGESMVSMDSTTRLLHTSGSQSFIDQTFIHWATLQEWAKRQWNRHYQHSPASSTRSAKRTSRPVPPRTAFTRAKPEFERRITEPITEVQTGGGGVLPGGGGVLPGGGRGFAGGEEDVELPSRDPVVVTAELQQLHDELEKHALESAKSYKPRRIFLPVWCRYLAWVLSALIITGCGTITILYGISFGRTKSTLWLQSLLFSFLQCVFITHPVFILLYSFYTAYKYRGDMSIFDHHDDGIIAQPGELSPRRRQSSTGLSSDEIGLEQGIAMRQRSRYLRYMARPPQEKQLIEARKNQMRRRATWGVVREGAGAAVMFVLLAVIAFGKNTNTEYNLNNALNTALSKSGPVPFESVRSVSDWWSWSETSLLDSLYWESWYNGEKTQFTPHVIETSVLIGGVSLRQVRVKVEQCDVPYQKLVNPYCRHGYSDDNKDQGVFVARGNESWYYGDNYMTRAGYIRGRHGMYDGGGFQVILPKTRADASKILNQLKSDRWIDRRTRAVVVEMTLFNPATNLFTGINLLAELPPSGGVTVSSQVTSVYLYKYVSAWDNFILACELLLVVATLMKFHLEMGEIIHQKKNYIKNPWNCVQVSLCAMLVSYLGCYIFRYVLIADAVELLRATYHEEFISVTFVAYWDQVLRSFVGFLLLVVMVQSLHLLRNQRVFVKFGAIYKKAASEIFCAAVVMLVWLCAYTSLGVALYAAATHGDLHSLGSGLGTTSSLLVGIYNLSGLEDSSTQQHGLRILIVTFLMFASGSLTCYIFAVLSYHYKRQKVGSLPSLTVPETLRLLWYKFLLTSGIVRPPRPESNDTNLPAEFTMAEIEYQVDEMLFKMNALSGTSGLPEKVPFYPTDSEPNSESLPGSEDGYDDLRVSERILRIEDNLMMSDQHLVQLLKLEGVAPDALSEEKEKQLRSVLELEIFRQLQLSRMERVRDTTSSGSTSDQTSSSYQRHLSTTSATSSGFPSGTSSSSTCTPNASPSETSVRRRLPGLTFPKPPSLGALFPNDLTEDPNEDDVFNREEVVTPKDINVHESLDSALGDGGAEGEGDRSHDPLILHDLSGSTGADTDGIPLQDLKPPASPSSSQDAETQEIMMRHDRKCSCGGSIRFETRLDDHHLTHTGSCVFHGSCSLTDKKLMGEGQTGKMNGMSKLAQFRPKGSEYQSKPQSFQQVPQSTKVTSSSDNVSGSSSTHEGDVRHPTSPAEIAAAAHSVRHGNRSRDNSCSHGSKKDGRHKHHKCHHHHKHRKHRSRSRSHDNKTITTVSKDSSSASEGEDMGHGAGAIPRNNKKSKSRSKARSSSHGSSSGGGQNSPSRTLVSRETMAFENRAFSSDNEGLSDNVKVTETEFREPRSRKRTSRRKDEPFDRDEVF